MGKGKVKSKAPVIIISGVSFAMILVLNILTPFLSDDYSYLLEVQKAESFADLFQQEYRQYMTWNGRSVVHFILRVFLYLPRPVFKIANSLAFVAVPLLILYLVMPIRAVAEGESGNRERGEDSSVRPGGREEVFTLLLAQMLLWLFSVDPSETILWEDGACNYLWGTMIILGFMAYGKRMYGFHCSRDREKGEKPAVWGGWKIFSCAFLLGVYGILAGWCNENTSGGCLLFILALLLDALRRTGTVSLPLLAGAVGNGVGLAVMVLSPGEHQRASYDTDESYTGILRYFSRFQKITLTLRDYFGILLAVLAVCLVILILQRNRQIWKQTMLYTFLFLATSYAMILSRPAQPRAFFGAGIFLDIALLTAVRGIVVFESEHPHSGTGYLLRAGGYGAAAVLMVALFFHYIDDGTNLARVYRDETRRTAWLEKQASEGKNEVDVYQVHPAFYNDYSAIGKMEMTEDDGYWINQFYEQYYGIEKIHAISYDQWAEENGIHTDD